MEGSSGRETASDCQVSLSAARGPAQYHGRTCSAGGGGTGSAIAGIEEAKATCLLQHVPRQSWSGGVLKDMSGAEMKPITNWGHCEWEASGH